MPEERIYNPSQKVIRRACKRIRAGWSAEERWRRSGGRDGRVPRDEIEARYSVPEMVEPGEWESG